MRIAAYISLALLASASLLPDAVASAQPDAGSHPKPMFVTLPNHKDVMAPVRTPAGQLPQWNGSFTDHLGQTVTYTMVGRDPATTNATSKVRVFIIPVKMVFGASNGNMTFDPLAVTLSNGQTLIQNILASPLFSNGVLFD